MKINWFNLVFILMFMILLGVCVEEEKKENFVMIDKKE